MTPFSRNSRNEGEARYRNWLGKAPSFIWKRFADGVSLRVYMFAPKGHQPEHFAPAVMFFGGGMWSLDFSTEFVAWAVHLAHRGIVCLLPEFRTRARYGVRADDIINDGLDAWKWLHHNAAGLGIDQSRITLAGADAGGLMALNCAMQPMIHEKKWWQFGKEDILPLQPACVAIFRGVVDTDAPEARQLNIPAEVTEPDSVNPCALLRRKLPTLFCAHGMLDPLLDFEMRQWFCDEWERLGNKVELILSPTADHTITQFDVNPATFEQLLLGWEDFMVREAIWPEPEVETDALMI